jgi:hypothetical protein
MAPSLPDISYFAIFMLSLNEILRAKDALRMAVR